jgi:hypothetical protein
MSTFEISPQPRPSNVAFTSSSVCHDWTQGIINDITVPSGTGVVAFTFFEPDIEEEDITYRNKNLIETRI